METGKERYEPANVYDISGLVDDYIDYHVTSDCICSSEASPVTALNQQDSNKGLI